MTLARARLLSAGLATALTAGSLLVAPPPAHATPVLTNARLSFGGAGYGYTTTCPPQGAAPAPGPSVALVENAAPASASHTVTRKFAAQSDATDYVTNSVTIQGRASATTSGGRPTSLAMGYNGTITASASKGTSPGCSAYTRLGVFLSTGFTLTAPTWATITIGGQGPGSTAVEISQSSGDFYLARSDDTDGAGSSTVLLPAGDYEAALGGDAWHQTKTAYTGARSGTASITFAVPGSASQAPSGKARKIVRLPAARDCGTHTATATWPKKKVIRWSVGRVTFTVNGTKVATVKGKKIRKGRPVVLPLADNAAADITATVIMKNGTKRKVRASYLACTN
ncbi:hypothetical protein ACFFOS_10725 [Nocardioides kongjuensis]|uniref:Uncharacterized protein n=1 Tax=Nocardioides kongjuensis TaxID=349522 RepID=A0A852R9A9_9ACTN|nr:hypothetical protein [Nocardioides kongjuensis]NYD31493.1 hypothetical protein [Nocardioides kongjuensis]